MLRTNDVYDPNERYSLASIRQDLIQNNMHVKAIVQDILAYRGTVLELETLNEAGRAKLALLRKCIELMDEWANDENDPVLHKEVDAHRQQFSRTLQSFRKANIATKLEIEKLEKLELFNNDLDDGGAGDAEDAADGLRQRRTAGNHRTGSGLVSQQDSVTERMLSISRHLSETTQRSATTLETLVASSANVEGTRDELHATAGSIGQSGKLLMKYGRRDCTDKVLLVLALAFFVSCVLYIVQKRVF